MCGICGYYSKRDYSGQLTKGLKTIAHRGPDACDLNISEFDGTNIGIGHVRLKILDLDDRSNQPFKTASASSLIAFNGEIYNFESLKKLLPNQTWRTTSDTEVVAELLEAYGNNIVSKFNGIFSISRLCLITGRLTLFRDPLGVKPLYYVKNNDELFFSSEIKALREFYINLEVSHEDLFECLNFGYVHEPNTGFVNVKKVAPGEILSIGPNGISSATFSYEAFDASSSILNELPKAIRSQTVSDVPLGVFFSGGLDSTVLASQVEADLFYINGQFDGENNTEQKYAEYLAKKLNRNINISRLSNLDNVTNTVDLVDEVVRGVEEPISDLTYLVSAELAKLARDKGYTVMLSGMGSDELFGGYLRYYILKHNWLTPISFRLLLLFSPVWKKISVHKLYRIKNFLNEKTFLRKYARLVGYFSRDDLIKCFGSDRFADFDNSVFTRLEESIPDNFCKNAYSSMRYLELRGFLSHNLIVSDKSSMKSGLELRVPLLDLNLFGNWFSGSNSKKNLNNLGKKPLLALMQSFIKYKWSPFKKTGFNPSIPLFLKEIDNVKLASQIICTVEMKSIFGASRLQDFINHVYGGKSINYYIIWQLIFISRWLKYWKANIVK